jgi:hypothetical protein
VKYVIVNGITQARQLRRIIAKLANIPVDGIRGTNVGKGRHVDQDAPGFPGRTLHLVDHRKHPTLQQWAVPITQRLRDLWADHKDRLTQAERQGVLDAIAAETDLDSSWDPVIP